MVQIGRTLHYKDFQSCSEAETFLWSKVTSKYRTILPRTGNFVWFRAMSERDSLVRHDWFGNVRCSVDLLDVLKQDPKINMFIVDRSYFGHSSATRILLTHQTELAESRKLNVNDLKIGDPIMFEDGKLMYLCKDLSEGKFAWWGNHQTEFVIDSDTVCGKQLFKMSKKEAVNHSHANRKVKNKERMIAHQCLIYNSSKKTCPSAWCQEYSQQMLDYGTASAALLQQDASTTTQRSRRNSTTKPSAQQKQNDDKFETKSKFNPRPLQPMKCRRSKRGIVAGSKV